MNVYNRWDESVAVFLVFYGVYFNEALLKCVFMSRIKMNEH